MTRSQLSDLRDLRGSEEDRLARLTGALGVRLQGRLVSSTAPELERLLGVVASNRGRSVELLAEYGIDA